MTRIRASWRYRCPLPVEGAQENERLRRVLAVDRPVWKPWLPSQLSEGPPSLSTSGHPGP